MNPGSRHRPRRAVTTAATTVAVVLLLRALAPAQDVTEPSLKAAYIYNFALFTEWPANALPAKAPFTICVVGDTAIGDAVQRDLKGRALSGHDMVLSRATVSAGLPRVCHIVYISGTTASQAAQLIAGVRDTPVLTISDVEGFASAGGIAQYYFEHGHLRFIVNLASIKRAGLQVSSRLLAVAKQL